MNQYWIRYILKFTWILDFFGFWREFCLQLFFDANFYWIGEKDRILHIFGIFQFIFNILVHKFQFCISKTIFTFNSDFSIFFFVKTEEFWRILQRERARNNVTQFVMVKMHKIQILRRFFPQNLSWQLSIICQLENYDFYSISNWILHT